MGDILRTVPALRALRRGLPAAKIRWVLDEGWLGLLDGHPDLDGLIPLPRKRISRCSANPGTWPDSLRAIGEFRSALRATGSDLAIDFHGNLRSGIAARLSAAPVRLGYAGHQQKEGNRWLTTHRIPEGERRTPRVLRNLALVETLGIAVEPLPSCDLPLVDRGAEAAAGVLSVTGLDPERFAVLSPSASVSQAYKIPPPEIFAAACDRAAIRGLRTLVVWGPGEEEQARQVVASAIEGAAKVAPPTTIPALAALIARGRLFVGADSGPLHLACAVGCPALGIYGPTDPLVNRPWGVPHRSVSPPGREYTGIKRIDRQRAFEGLRSVDVTSAIDELISEIETQADA